jgi:hypothetical protein
VSLDRPTRGRTRPGRLAVLDRWLLQAEAGLISREDGPFRQAVAVDVGFGAGPWTTLEWARSLRSLRPDLRVVGVDLDPDRVAAALPLADARTDFRQGGFDLPLGPEEPALLVRAMNVLRQYPASAVTEAHARLAARLLPGGALLEGSSDREGGVLVAHLLRAGPSPCREALVFATGFDRGFAPMLFRDWLPRDLRRRCVPGEPIRTFLDAWTRAWEEVRAAGLHEARAAFSASARLLAEWEPGVEPGDGIIAWRPPGGVPLPREVGW